jgi:hypothetical protein
MAVRSKPLALALAVVMASLVGSAASAGAAPAPLVAAVGDIACAPGAPATRTACHQAKVAKAMAAIKPDSVWLLGDIQYPNGSLADFRGSFGPAFSRLASRWRPSPGNHEYFTPGAAGYYDFFGKQAGPDRRGYYSFNLGRWHVVSLNSNCDVVDACSADSAQVKWLRADLKKNARYCTAAFWHHPLYSSGLEHGNDPMTRPLWQILERHRAELVLTGHDHDFEAFPRQDALGVRDRSRGIAEFVVGTGGKSQYPFGPVQPNSLVRHANVFGFMALRLKRGAFTWRFVNDQGESLSTGSSRCH